MSNAFSWQNSISLCPASFCISTSTGSWKKILKRSGYMYVYNFAGDWNAKVGSQETPGVTGKFGLGIWNEAGQRL